MDSEAKIRVKEQVAPSDSPEPRAAERQSEATAAKLDWDALRRRSLEPGGFGDDRVHIWPELLHVEPPTSTEASDVSSANTDMEVHGQDEDSTPHTDERQIRLDTDRSFVLYPVDENVGDRGLRQSELHDLIVKVFRRHAGLSYFQGYHDIITIIMLTLPPDVQLSAAEKLSLQRLRDSMGSTLEPLMGLLKILQRLLRLADPTYASLLEEQSPLPYPALSHLLTLFAHDILTLPLAQHVFDFLLTRPPIAIVYLAAAVMLSRRDEVARLEQEGEDGMIHSMLTSLPELVDEVVIQGEQEEKVPTEKDGPAEERIVKTADDGYPQDDAVKPVIDGPDAVKAEREEICGNADEIGLLNASEYLPNASSEVDVRKGDDVGPSEQKQSSEEASERPSDVFASDSKPTVDDATDSSPQTLSPPDFGDAPVPPYLIHPRLPLAPHDIPLPPSRSQSRSPSPAPAPRREPRVLSNLLKHADTLMQLYPPTHPALLVDQTMGPASVVHTWSEDATALPSDIVAEAIVVSGRDIVLQGGLHDESLSADEEKARSDSSDERDDEKGWFGARRRRLGKEKEDTSGKRGRRRRKLQKHRRPVFGAVVERRTMFAGAALVLGVAMAVSLYGMHARGGGASAGGLEGEWKRAGKMLGALAGLGGRLFGGAEGLGL